MNIAALFSPAPTPSAASATAPARDDALARRDKAKLEEARNALQALKQRPSQAAEERKAMARKKIDQLKARIRMLQMSAAMDPKGVAKLAAQLARELGAAVKAYASAGGSTAELGATHAAAIPSGDAAGAEKGAEGAANAAVSGAEAAEASGAEAKLADNGSDQQETANAGDQDAEGQAQGQGSGQSQAADPYRKLIDEVNARGAEMARRGSESEADREFMTQVKGMANALKAALRQARNRAEDGDGASPTDARDGDRAMADLEKEIAGADKALNPGVSLMV